jgi:hypothetical protein
MKYFVESAQEKSDEGHHENQRSSAAANNGATKVKSSGHKQRQ